MNYVYEVLSGRPGGRVAGGHLIQYMLVCREYLLALSHEIYNVFVYLI